MNNNLIKVLIAIIFIGILIGSISYFIKGGTPCVGNVTFSYMGNNVTYGMIKSPTGRCWMDRNLGATQVATSYNDSAAYGDLFQWGRDDDGHQLRTSEVTTNLSSSDKPGHAKFIFQTLKEPYDWKSPQNNTRWQYSNNNPCPSGWRVPTSNEWMNEIKTGDWKNYNSAYSSPLKLTAAGYRYSTDSVLYNEGSYGCYWSSSARNIWGINLFLTEDQAYIDYNNRASGLSVRCIRD